MPTYILKWEVEIRKTVGAQTANVMAAKKIIQSWGALKKKATNEQVPASIFLLLIVLGFNLDK